MKQAKTLFFIGKIIVTFTIIFMITQISAFASVDEKIATLLTDEEVQWIKNNESRTLFVGSIPMRAWNISTTMAMKWVISTKSFRCFHIKLI